LERPLLEKKLELLSMERLEYRLRKTELIWPTLLKAQTWAGKVLSLELECIDI
jgi:hypothetical protein